MIKREIKSQLFSMGTLCAILLMFVLFMTGKSGEVLPGGKSTTVLDAIYNKLNGNWQAGMSSSAANQMMKIWTSNMYIAVLLPIVTGIPFVFKYITEVRTQNKRFVLVRTTVKRYWLSKIIATVVTSTVITVIAIAIYDATLYIFYDSISELGEDGELVKTIFVGEGASDMSLWFAIIKSNCYFVLFANVCGAFAMFITLISSDVYITLGTTVLIVYVQQRLFEGLIKEYIKTQSEMIGNIANIVDPSFLNYAGRNGFYKDKEILAVMIEVTLMFLLYFLSYLYFSGQKDLCAK